jgi:hypothetical protein
MKILAMSVLLKAPSGDNLLILYEILNFNIVNFSQAIIKSGIYRKKVGRYVSGFELEMICCGRRKGL